MWKNLLTIPLVRIDENEVMNPNLSEDIIENETFHKLRVHLRNVKYDCDQCSHSSFSDVALKKHKRKVHQKKK